MDGERGTKRKATADGQIDDGQIADGQIANGQTAQRGTKRKATADGQIADGQIADGQIANGQTADAEEELKTCIDDTFGYIEEIFCSRDLLSMLRIASEEASEKNELEVKLFHNFRRGKSAKLSHTETYKVSTQRYFKNQYFRKFKAHIVHVSKCSIDQNLGSTTLDTDCAKICVRVSFESVGRVIRRRIIPLHQDLYLTARTWPTFRRNI